MNGRDLLASGGYATVRILDPATGTSLITIPIHYQALAVSQAATLLAIGLNAGILVIKLNLG